MKNIMLVFWAIHLTIIIVMIVVILFVNDGRIIHVCNLCLILSDLAFLSKDEYYYCIQMQLHTVLSQLY